MTAVPIEKRSVSKARREKILAAQDGVCKRAHCDAPAVDVDHIIPLVPINVETTVLPDPFKTKLLHPGCCC